METFIGIAIWVAIFLVWYIRTYPEKVKGLIPLQGISLKWPVRKKRNASSARKAATAYGDYKSLVDGLLGNNRFQEVRQTPPRRASHWVATSVPLSTGCSPRA